MASVSYQCCSLRHRVFQPQTTPEPHQPPPLFVQIELTITLRLRFIRHHCTTGGFTNSTSDCISQQTLRFDLPALRIPNLVHQILAPVLTRLGINPTSVPANNVIHEILELGNRLLNCTSSYGPIVLPICAEIWGTVLLHINNQVQEVSTRCALSESVLEFEASNYGMIPAQESRRLKKVNVEDGDDGCVICLEELKVGSYASQMPCSHMFHSNCIESWLKKKNNCPICRFEMPA
ncbi:hypothetical protein DITRI_Ditri17bG0129600 [Diplodiscus trichospermus]